MKHVIVGNGVAGVTAAQTIVRADPTAEVHVFGAEPYPYYRRPLLWEFITGQIEQDDLYFRPAEWYAERGIHLHTGVQVTALASSDHRLTLRPSSGRALRPRLGQARSGRALRPGSGQALRPSSGQVLASGETATYDRLLLATGGRPFVPPCAGTDKEGVFTLRTLKDAQAIKAYAQEVSTAIVIGGGLLGLETARALRTAGLDVTVVEFFPHLLPRQLDAEGAAVLQSLLEAQGLRIITGGTTEAVGGNGRADYIWLQDRRTIPGELVIFSTGIRSETTLAQAAGLKVNRGIVVDGQLRTMRVDGQPEEDIFAAGDAAEFEGRVYGIIPPAIEQARVAAANMVTPGSRAYTGTLPATTLKVAGAGLTSLGECIVDTDEYVQLRHTDLPAGHYRKFVLRDGRIVGAILLNDEERVRPVAQLIERGADVSAHTDRLLDDDFDLKSLLQAR